MNVEEPTGRSVDRVLRVTRTKQRPRDCDLGHLDRDGAVGVVDGERHLGSTEGRPAGRAHEDHILHLGAAQRTRALGAKHPGHCVDDI